MAKPRLNLSIDNDLLTIAKNFRNPDGSLLNLSGEFEEWLRIRINQNSNDNKEVDTDIEIAKLRAEIQKLQSQAEIKKNMDMEQKEELMVIDSTIDNELHYTDPKDIPEKRANGLVFLMKKKFNKKLEFAQAKELLALRMKERKLIDDNDDIINKV